MANSNQKKDHLHGEKSDKQLFCIYVLERAIKPAGTDRSAKEEMDCSNLEFTTSDDYKDDEKKYAYDQPTIVSYSVNDVAKGVCIYSEKIFPSPFNPLEDIVRKTAVGLYRSRVLIEAYNESDALILLAATPAGKAQAIWLDPDGLQVIPALPSDKLLEGEWYRLVSGTCLITTEIPPSANDVVTAFIPNSIPAE